MRVKLKYYVILSLDIPKGNYEPKLKEVKPAIVKYPKFVMTEDGVEDPEWCAVHRKYCGILTPEETKTFLEDEFSDTCQTMGSLTIEYGWMPAISFSNEDCRFWLNAYVTPILNDTDEELLLKEVAEHPQPDEIKRRVGRKLEQSLDLLEKFFDYRHVAKSFFVDTKQLSLQLE